ncbi:glutaminyl-peptide cyclotransferase [Mucilaginibacter sp.]
MNNKFKLFLAAVVLVAFGCKQKTEETSLTLSPDPGTSYKQGDKVNLKLHYSNGSTPDSIVYFVDSTRIASLKDSSGLSVKTDTMLLGPRVFTAKFYQGGKSVDASTNIILYAAKAPEEYTYKVIRKFPHDTSAYIEGLLYQDGFLYESTGGDQSSLRKVDLVTGKVVQQVKLDKKYFDEHQIKMDTEYFGEGISIIGDKILMLSYRQPETALVFDKNSFKLLKTFINNVGVEGWGMTFDGKKIYFDDRTNRIWFLNKDTYQQTGYIDVYDDKHAIDSVNELEYIDNKIYANIYQKENIVVIDPKTGAVLQRVDMKNLWPVKDRPANFDNDENVLNGIAWDEKGKRLFVTGKKWPYLYQVEFVKKTP